MATQDRFARLCFVAALLPFLELLSMKLQRAALATSMRLGSEHEGRGMETTYIKDGEMISDDIQIFKKQVCSIEQTCPFLMM